MCRPTVVCRALARAARALGSPEPEEPVDRAAIVRALERAGGNMTRAAELLVKDRGQLYRMCKKLLVDAKAFRGG